MFVAQCSTSSCCQHGNVSKDAPPLCCTPPVSRPVPLCISSVYLVDGMALGRSSCVHLAIPPHQLSKTSSKIKTRTSKQPPVSSTWRLCIPSGITELPCALGANSCGQSVLYARGFGVKLSHAPHKCSLIRLKSKTILAQLASGTYHRALLCPKQYHVQFGANPGCPSVHVNADTASVQVCSSYMLSTKGRRSAWNRPIRAPPSAQGLQWSPQVRL